MTAENVVLVFEVLGGLVQLCAAVLALTLIRSSGKQLAWIFLTCGFILQAWRRFYVVWQGPSAAKLHESVTGLAVSVFMLLGVLSIRHVFAELAGARAKLEHLARSDSLTGLPNRATFLAVLEREISRVRRGSRSTVLFADIDGFKECNDTHGHAFGDAVLRAIADAFRDVVRQPDIIARIGGDEFGVCLNEADVEDGNVAASRLRRAVRGVGARMGVDLDLSVGVVPVGVSLSAEGVVAAADMEMYAAKRLGRPLRRRTDGTESEEPPQSTH